MAITLNGSTGVTAAEFDGALDASNLTGALPAIDGSALTGIDTAPPTTFGDVGTYALVGDADGTDITVGVTRAGSSLDRSYSIYNFQYAAITPLSGTWRCMGYGGGGLNGTLFVRIS